MTDRDALIKELRQGVKRSDRDGKVLAGDTDLVMCRAADMLEALSGPGDAPGHTDLMVSPESLDAWLKDNPPPAGDVVSIGPVPLQAGTAIGQQLPVGDAEREELADALMRIAEDPMHFAQYCDEESLSEVVEAAQLLRRPVAPVVTDEMVERARDAYNKAPYAPDDDSVFKAHRNGMKAALEAALLQTGVK